MSFRLVVVAGAILVTSLAQPPRLSQAVPPLVWYHPVISNNHTFPVLRPAGGGWLTWRDSFGDPVLKRNEKGEWQEVARHEGIDVFAEIGTPVIAAVSGTIDRAGWTEVSGWRLGLRGDDGLYYFHAHLDRFETGLVAGKRVAVGERIGFLGNSGFGPEGTKGRFPAHLHFGIQKNNQWEDPKAFLDSTYDSSVAHTERSEAEIKKLKRMLAVVRSRAQAPGAPNTTAIVEKSKGLQGSIDRLQTELLMR